MIVIVDASTLLNLANGEVLGKILHLPNISFQVSSVVRRESRTIAVAIDDAVAGGSLSLVDDSLISASAFTSAKSAMRLDDGETECIIAAEAISCTVACDDKAARRHIKRRMGAYRLTGSIGLMKRAISAGLLPRTAAYDAYKLMVARGGFLPRMEENDF